MLIYKRYGNTKEVQGGAANNSGRLLCTVRKNLLPKAVRKKKPVTKICCPKTHERYSTRSGIHGIGHTQSGIHMEWNTH